MSAPISRNVVKTVSQFPEYCSWEILGEITTFNNKGCYYSLIKIFDDLDKQLETELELTV